ncbi:rhodanese-like domain-containing protein [Marinobacter sp. DSM 26671]|uniref:rhodanese-like domain-containing protein n=1 Tax=Marinobacter sp. DSM 26671 TaxID=1761793 RepID=UPI000B88936F|nr:rhodanese-like domain-containing protein [Marinobacter sp. DSM 26671]
MQNVTAPDLAASLARDEDRMPLLLDVREPWEFQICRIDGSVSMPMNTVPERLSELDSDRPIVCICHHGVRSMDVALFLERKGFSRIINLSGGIHAWATQVDAQMPTY